MQGGVKLGLILVLGALIAANASAQTSGSVEIRLLIQCAEGDTSACTRYSLAQRLQIDEDGNASFAPRDSTVRMTPARARVTLGLEEAPQSAQETADAPTPAPVSAPVPAETAPSNQTDGVASFWKWIAIVLLGFFALFVYAMFRVGPGENQAEKPQAKPALPRPPIRKGARTVQGDLIGPADRAHQIVPWDTSKVMAWLAERESEERANVTDEGLLELCNSKATAARDDGSLMLEASQYLSDNPDDYGAPNPWKLPEHRLVLYVSAQAGMVGSAYAIANSLWDSDEELDHSIITALFRLDADQEFNPACVNLHGYLYTGSMRMSDYIDSDVLEAYLRQSFDIGAPDGHFHIATQVMAFYLYSSPEQKDEGYVAAAFRRVQAYGGPEVRTYRDRFKEYPDYWDTDDLSVSTNGMMYEQRAAAQAGPMQ